MSGLSMFFNFPSVLGIRLASALLTSISIDSTPSRTILDISSSLWMRWHKVSILLLAEVKSLEENLLLSACSYKCMQKYVKRKIFQIFSKLRHLSRNLIYTTILESKVIFTFAITRCNFLHYLCMVVLLLQ